MQRASSWDDICGLSWSQACISLLRKLTPVSDFRNNFCFEASTCVATTRKRQCTRHRATEVWDKQAFASEQSWKLVWSMKVSTLLCLNIFLLSPFFEVHKSRAHYMAGIPRIFIERASFWCNLRIKKTNLSNFWLANVSNGERKIVLKKLQTNLF